MKEGLRFLQSLPCIAPGPFPKPHAWEYPVRKLQAPNFRIVYSPSTSSRPQTPKLCTPPRGGPLPSSRTVYSPARRAPPSSTRGSTVFASFRPQIRELCTPQCGGPLPSSTRGSTLFASFRPQTPNCVLPRAAGPSPAARVGVPSQASGPKLRVVYSRARRAPPQQHAWEYPFRKLQAPNSRIVYSVRSGPPQQHVWEHPFRKLQAPNSRIVYSRARRAFP